MLARDGGKRSRKHLRNPRVGTQDKSERFCSEAEPSFRCPWVFLGSMASVEKFHSWSEPAGRRADTEDALRSEMRAVKLLKSFLVCNIALHNGSSGCHRRGGQNALVVSSVVVGGPSALTPDSLHLVYVSKDILVCKDCVFGTWGWILRENWSYFSWSGRKETAS